MSVLYALLFFILYFEIGFFLLERTLKKAEKRIRILEIRKSIEKSISEMRENHQELILEYKERWLKKDRQNPDTARIEEVIFFLQNMSFLYGNKTIPILYVIFGVGWLPLFLWMATAKLLRKGGD
jgi:hypothetical protein